MTIINGVQHSPDLYYENRASSSMRAGSSRQTMGVGGRTIRQSTITTIKRTIVLTATKTGDTMVGFFTHEQMLALQLLEEDGAIFPIDYEGEIITVWVAPGGVDLSMRLPRPNPDPDDMYYGTVMFEEI